MKIIEIPVKYIVCDDCNYEESCRLPSESQEKSFKWVCPGCGQFWQADKEDGAGEIKFSKVSIEDRSDFISIALGTGLRPMVVLAIDKEKKRKVFRFLEEETNMNSNPKNVKVYRVLQI